MSKTPAADDKAGYIRQQFDYYTTEWQPIRDEGDEDMRYVAGDPWTESDKRLREQAMRPIQVTDELHQFFNQVINDVRMNPRAVKFSPTGFGTNDARATFYTDKWREVEYRSNAVRHYITALENAIYRSYGWTRVTSRYESPRTKNQELWVESVPNPNMVVPDPDSLQPDSSDMRGLFAYHLIDRKEFIRRFPEAKVTDFTRDVQKSYPTWVKSRDRLQLAEYWEVEALQKRLMVVQRDAALKLIHQDILGDDSHEIHQQLQQGTPVGLYVDELSAMPHDDDILDIRQVEDRKVTQYLTNGIEILETNPWAGKYIPFASCFGKVLYLDDKGQMERQILSMTRLARNPYMALCYLATTELELIGMMPKFPYFYYEGQLSPAALLDLQKSLHEPIAGIPVKPFLEGMSTAQLLPPPSRQPYEPPLQTIEIAKEAARRSIQSAMGITPLPTPAQRNNEKTGAALGRIESSGQKGSFHFVDNYDAMIRRIGVIGEDLLTPVYDTMRMTGVRDALGNAKQVIINDPSNPDSSTKGTFLVTVSSGPSFESAREASQDFVSSLLQSPTLLQAAGPQITAKVYAMGIRLQNLGEIGNLVADLLDPPPNKALTPQQMQMQLQQMGQKVQQLNAALQKATQDLATDATKTKGMLLGKQIEGQTQLTLKRMDDATKITVAMIGAKTKTSISDNEARDEALALGIQVEHEERMAAHEHAAAGLADAAQHFHNAKRAVQDHASAVLLMLQDHQHELEQMRQQHALLPPPATPEPGQAAAI